MCVKQLHPLLSDDFQEQSVTINFNKTNLSVFFSLQCRRILGGRNLVRVRNVVVAPIFDFMTVEDWGE